MYAIMMHGHVEKKTLLKLTARQRPTVYET